MRFAAALAIAAFGGVASHAQFVPTQPVQPIQELRTQVVATNVINVLWCGSPPDDSSRLYLLGGERSGASTCPLWLVKVTYPQGDNGPPTYTRLPQPIMNLTGSGRSLAFAPDYAASGYAYVATQDPGTSGSTITRFRRSDTDADRLDPLSAFTVMKIPGARFDHAVGSMHFGPDGMLYVGIGDEAGHPQQNSTLGGKMIRIDVAPGRDDFPDDANRNYGIPAGNPYLVSATTNAPRPEIWHVGLRNPWRWSFDRVNGDTWIGNVGDFTEEINIHRRGPFAGAGSPLENFGYPLFDGDRPLNSGPLLAGTTFHKPDLVFPRIGNFDNRVRGYIASSIVGGFVYRGSAIPSLRGYYLTADTYNPWILAFRADAPHVPPVNLTLQLRRTTTGQNLQLANIVSFGEDADGELYFCEYGVRVRKIVPYNPPPQPARIEAPAATIGAPATDLKK